MPPVYTVRAYTGAPNVLYCSHIGLRTGHPVAVDLDVLEQLDDVQRSGTDARREQRLRRLYVMRTVKMIGAGSVAVVRPCNADTAHH